MINDKSLEKLIEETAKLNNVDPKVVDLVVNNCYKFIREVIKDAKESGDAKTIMLGSYGKFYPSIRKINAFKEIKEYNESRKKQD